MNRTISSRSFGLSARDIEKIDALKVADGIASRSELLRRVVDRAYREMQEAKP